jgi:drug/metabolite transporter (DMT)-like permease
MSVRQPGVREAVLAAMLFGAATPFASRVVGEASPQVLAGLLYLGSGLLLGVSMLAWPTRRQAPLTRRELPPLAGAIFFGGALGPLLLMFGLRSTPAPTASLLLNLEVVFTAVIAWVIFHESLDRRVAVGFALIVGGGVVLSWNDHGAFGLPAGALAVAAACGCWAIDNNLTQKISAKDPRQIATLKGLLAGGANLAIGLLAGGSLPAWGATAATMSIGLVGYGDQPHAVCIRASIARFSAHGCVLRAGSLRRRRGGDLGVRRIGQCPPRSCRRIDGGRRVVAPL